MGSGGWNGGVFTVDDGRKFMLDSEHVRGEGRYYYALVWDADAERWRSFTAVDGSYNKRTVMRRIENYARTSG